MKTTYDIIIVGGGLTGVAAACAAARRGADVLLVEASGCLGGALAQNLVYPFMSNATVFEENGVKKRVCLSQGFYKELCDALRLTLPETDLNTHRNEEFDMEHMKVLLDTLCVQSGVTLLFHATLCAVKSDGKQIHSLSVATKAGLTELYANTFIDATGDGDLMAFAGCAYQIGRDADNLCQPMTLCFRVTGVNDELFREDFPKITPLYNEFQKQGKIKNIRENVLMFRNLGKGIVHFNSTRVIKLNPVDPVDLSRAEVEARKQMIELYDFVRENFESFKDATLAFSAVSIGVRESRKLIGEYVLTQEDLVSCRRFDDAVATGNYDIDIHNPAGTGTSHYYFKPGEYYTIPYRSFLPKEYDNLLVSGRCLSATHEAQASVRIMPICCCMGEAAGLAAFLAKANGGNVKNIDIAALHKLLDENGAKYR